MRNTTLFITVTLSALLWSCNDSSNSSANKQANAVATPGKQQQASLLTGVWQLPCTLDIHSQNPTYQVGLATFSASSLTGVLRTYTDAGCTVLKETFTITYSYSLGAASQLLPGATEYNTSFVAWTITPGSAADANESSQSYASMTTSACRSLVFQQGVATDMMACMQAEGEIAPDYSLIRISGNQLQFGDCSDDNACKSAAVRTTKLGQEVFTKIQ